MKFIESLKLRYRANKYKNKNDKGGIAYLLLSVKEGQTAFDIGAHKAGYLYFMRKKVGMAGKVFAFEPQTTLYNYIAKIKSLFNWENVKIEHLALSDTAGKVTLYIPSNEKSEASSPGASIVQLENFTGINATEEVKTDTLDAYCEKHDIQPNFLKIDVEGNELKVFNGGIKILEKYKPKILVEIEARHVGRTRVLETFNFLEKLGYQGYFILGTERISLTSFNFESYQNTDDKKNYCNNFVFE